VEEKQPKVLANWSHSHKKSIFQTFGSISTDSLMLLFTQYNKCMWRTAISSHGLAALPAKVPAFNSHMQQNAYYRSM